MSKISKQTANNIAHALCKKIKEDKGVLEKELAGYVYKEYIKQIPKDVMACYNKHKKWFSQKSGVIITGKGHSWHTVYAIDSFPSASSNDAVLEMSDDVANKIKSLENDIAKLKDKYTSMVETIEIALINLGTEKRIIEHFPEAAKFLPKKFPPPAINIDNIRKQLNTL